MSFRRYRYVIAERETVAHALDGKVLTVTQADLLGGDSQSNIYLDREAAAKLRDALDQWLGETK